MGKGRKNNGFILKVLDAPNSVGPSTRVGANQNESYNQTLPKNFYFGSSTSIAS